MSKVLVRIDLNAGGTRNSYKVRRYAEMVRDVYSRWGDAVHLVTHFGRRGEKGFKRNLQFLADVLEELSGKPVRYIDSLEGTDTPGIYLLPNIRAFDGETEGSRELAEYLAREYDRYVNDALAVSHRAHVSVILPELVDIEAEAGPLLKEELEKLQNVKTAVILWGGVKLDKKKYIEALLKNGAEVVLGGIPALKYVLALKGEENEMSPLRKYREQIILPDSFQTEWGEIDAMEYRGQRVVDISERAARDIADYVREKDGVLSGPFGIYEQGYRNSRILMEAVKVILGGNSSDLAAEEGFEEKCITAGGAALAYLAGYELPGLRALKIREPYVQ